MAERHLIDAGEDPVQWDRYVDANPLSTFCHQAGWRGVMTEVLGHESLYLAVVDSDGTWHGVLPLVRVRGILGHYLISVPFLSDGGPLGDVPARRALVMHAIDEAERSGARLLEFRSRTEVPGPVAPTNRRIAVHLDLPATHEQLWRSILRGKLRAQVRRPGKEGMRFTTGGVELDAFYRVFAQNMRDLGTPVLPRSFFERLSSAFSDRVIFGVVRTNAGEPVAAACSFVWRNEIEVMWASSIRRFNKWSPNMLLYASLMEEAISRGLTLFNFGRCELGSPTHRFKQQWGGRDVPLPWPSWSRDTDASVPTKDRGVFTIATAIWRRLPLALTNRLGPRLSRMLP